MQKYNGQSIRQFASNVSGNAASGVTVTVRRQSDAGLATLYVDNNIAGATLSNPITTTDKGFFAFYAADGVYTLTFSDGTPQQVIQLQDVGELQAQFDAAVLNAGYIPSGTFSVGATLTQANQVLSDGSSYWRWDGSFEKVVTAGSAPTPVGVGGWFVVSDFALRGDLGASDSTVLVAGIEASELAKNFDSYVNAANYLAGAASDSAAVTAAIATAGNKAVLIPDIGRRWNLVNIQLNDDQTVFGYGTEIELTTNAGALFHGKRSVIHGFNFYGSGKASGSTSQNAVSIISSLTAGAEKTRTKTYDCNFYDLGGSAWIVRNTVNNHEGNILSNYHIKDCNIGVNLDVRGEYANWGNGNISLCNVGVRVQGGNSIATGSVISDCAIAVELVNGSNDSHGAVVGALINHNTVTIRAGVLQSKAFSFQSCLMYYGKIELTGTEGLTVSNCELFAVPIYEDGAVKCTFRNNKWLDDPVNYPNYNSNASEVFYIDNQFPPTTSIVQQWGIDGGYLRARRTSSITNILAGTDRDVVFNNRESNSITGNLGYTKQLFLDTATGYLNTLGKYIKRQFNNNVTSVINIGIADTSSLPTKAEVDVVLYDTVEGMIKGVFTAGPEYTTTGFKLRNYYFNGVLPKGIYVVRILNRSSQTLTSFSDQPATPNIRSYITADM